MPSPEQQRVRLTRVIDGDTVEVLAGGGLFRGPGTRRIRLYGIDAPESSQRGGPESTKHLGRIIGGRTGMWLTSIDTDQYGRTVGLIHSKKGRPEDSYNYRMVRDGQARCYMTRPEDRERYQEAEDAARSQGRGIWKDRNAAAPWDYRKAQREREARRSRGTKFILIGLTLVLLAAGALYLLRAAN